MKVNRRTDDVSDESIVSQKFAEQAVLNRVGKVKKIENFRLQVALKEE